MSKKWPVVSAFMLLLPGVWWVAQTVPTHFYWGWDHDPQFYRIYLLALLATSWLSEPTGYWFGTGYAVAFQDAVVALVVTLALAVLATLWRGWQQDAPCGWPLSSRASSFHGSASSELGKGQRPIPLPCRLSSRTSSAS
jgi:hypothetical protein